MKMTKMITLAVAMMAGSLFADYQYLYWMVDITGESSDYQFNYATVSMNGTLLDNNDSANASVGSYIMANAVTEAASTALGYVAGEGKGNSYWAYDVTGFATSTFLFELFDASDNRVAWKQVSGSSLANYIQTTGMSQVESPYVVSGVVPEPTSGLLLLLGIAGLALKRKQA